MTKSHPVRLILILTFGLGLLVFGFSAGLKPTGFADADEIATMAYVGGVAHPPGYPLYLYLLSRVMHLFNFLEPAQVANLGSAFFMGLCLALGAALNFRILSSKYQAQSILISIGSSFLIGLSALVWLYGAVSEVFAFGLFWAMGALFFAANFWVSASPKHIYKWWYLTLIFAAFGVAHLQTVILIYPTLFLILLINLPKISRLSLSLVKPLILGLVLWSLCFLLAQSLMLPLNHNRASVSWTFPNNLAGVVRMVKRVDYSGKFTEDGTTRAAYTLALPSTPLPSLVFYLKNFIDYLTWPISLIGFCGFILMLIRSKPKFLVWGSNWLVTGPLFAIYLGLPQSQLGDLNYRLDIGIIQRHYLLGFLTFIPFVAWGLYSLHKALFRGYTTRVSFFLLSVLLVCLISLALYQNYPVGFQRNNTYLYEYARNMLNSVSPGSLIICTSDPACYSLFYAHYVNKLRPDVYVLPKVYQYAQNILIEKPYLYPFYYVNNPDFTANLIAINLAVRPVYLTNVTLANIRGIGLNGEPFYLAPEGYLFRISATASSSLKTNFSTNFSQTLLDKPPSDRNFYASGLSDYAAGLHLLSADLAKNYGNLDLYETQKSLAKALIPKSNLVQALPATISAQNIPVSYRDGVSVSGADLLKQAKQSIKIENYQLAYDTLKKYLLLSPLDLEARQTLIDLLIAGGFLEAAQLETANLKALGNNP